MRRERWQRPNGKRTMSRTQRKAQRRREGFAAVDHRDGNVPGNEDGLPNRWKEHLEQFINAENGKTKRALRREKLQKRRLAKFETDEMRKRRHTMITWERAAGSRVETIRGAL